MEKNAIDIKQKKYQQGFSLIEFMVAIVISMAVVIAASYVYLNTRETQRTLSEKAFMFESARFAMDIIGRDIENAGFYPIIRAENAATQIATTTAQEYTPPNSLKTVSAFMSHVFGCSSERFLPVTSVCGAQPTGVDADSLVVNYFTNDAFGLDSGQRSDCQRQEVGRAAENADRLPAGFTSASAAVRSQMLPARPFFVSNRYTLSPVAMEVEGRTINTSGLACNGNGVSSAGNTYQPIITGIDQLRFTYMVRTGAKPDYRHKFFLASKVTDDANWPNVIGIKVCLLARSLEGARANRAVPYTLADCTGANPTFADGAERRVFSQVFMIRSKLSDPIVF